MADKSIGSHVGGPEDRVVSARLGDSFWYSAMMAMPDAGRELFVGATSPTVVVHSINVTSSFDGSIPFVEYHCTGTWQNEVFAGNVSLGVLPFTSRSLEVTYDATVPVRYSYKEYDKVLVKAGYEWLPTAAPPEASYDFGYYLVSGRYGNDSSGNQINTLTVAPSGIGALAAAAGIERKTRVLLSDGTQLAEAPYGKDGFLQINYSPYAWSGGGYLDLYTDTLRGNSYIPVRSMRLTLSIPADVIRPEPPDTPPGYTYTFRVRGTLLAASEEYPNADRAIYNASIAAFVTDMDGVSYKVYDLPFSGGTFAVLATADNSNVHLVWTDTDAYGDYYEFIQRTNVTYAMMGHQTNEWYSTSTYNMPVVAVVSHVYVYLLTTPIDPYPELPYNPNREPAYEIYPTLSIASLPLDEFQSEWMSARGLATVRERARRLTSTTSLIENLRKGDFLKVRPYVRIVHPMSSHAYMAQPLLVTVVSETESDNTPDSRSCVRVVRLSYTYKNEAGETVEDSQEMTGTVSMQTYPVSGAGGEDVSYSITTYTNWTCFDANGNTRLMDFAIAHPGLPYVRTTDNTFYLDREILKPYGTPSSYVDYISGTPQKHSYMYANYSRAGGLFSVINGTYLLGAANILETFDANGVPYVPPLPLTYKAITVTYPDIYHRYRARIPRCYDKNTPGSYASLDGTFADGEIVTVFPVSVYHQTYGSLGMFPYEMDIEDVHVLSLGVVSGFAFRYTYLTGAWTLVGERPLYVGVGENRRIATDADPVKVEYYATDNIVFMSGRAAWPDVSDMYKAQKTFLAENPNAHPLYVAIRDALSR